jgi:hypothetical protein
MMAAFADLERVIIHERTMAGLAAAKAPGPQRRTPHRDDADELAAARARRERADRARTVTAPHPGPPGGFLGLVRSEALWRRGPGDTRRHDFVQR